MIRMKKLNAGAFAFPTVKKCGQRASRETAKTESRHLAIEVECYAGYKAGERPLRFRFKTKGAETLEMRELLDQWYGPEDQYFKVRANDGHLYILRHNEHVDLWTLDAFQITR